jgi:two-component system, NtrC family, nitrogen regulation response regulator GlnG
MSAPLRVLVVDDEPLVCWSIAETLGAGGDIVTEAHTGAAALRALSEASQPVDVVFLDYQLPDVHHLSLLSTFRRVSPASRVILMSAHATPEIVEEALGRGASRVIGKPFDMCDVLALVHDVAKPH